MFVAAAVIKRQVAAMNQTVEIVQITPSRLRDLIREETGSVISQFLQSSKDEKVAREWLSTAEVMEFLGLSRASLLRLRSNGRLPFSKISAGIIRYRRSDLEVFLQDNLLVPGAGEVA